MLLLQQMIVLFLLMVLGYYMRRIGKLSEETEKTLSWIVVNVANPAMILSGSVTSENGIKGTELLMTMVLAVGVFAGLILISFVMPLVLRVPTKSVGVYRVMTIFCNIGFMGFPVISALYGTEALLYASVFLIPFNLLIYTYGILALKGNSGEKNRIEFRKVLNIGVLCCIVSLILSFVPVSFPSFVTSTISMLSSLTAPLSMMVIGASIAGIKLKDLFADKKLLVFSILKLIVVPVIGLLMLKKMVDSEMLLGVCMVMIATPAASMTAMLAQQYDGDYELASKGVALTTVLSVLTMPLVSLITGV